MKLSKLTTILSLASLPMAAIVTAQQPQAQGEAPQQQQQAPQTHEQLDPMRILEIYGYIVGLQSGVQDFDLNEEEFNAFLQGLRSAQARDEMPRNLEQLFPQLQMYLSQRQAQVVEQRAQENRERAEEFFAELRDQEGIRRTEDGVYYRIERPGQGDRPDSTDTVRIHYEGRLIDGTVFDSSRERGEPADFPLMGVIPGMASGLKELQEGARATLYIPPDLAYGDQSQPTIPAGSALIFEVELLEVLEGEPGQALQPFQLEP